MSEFHSILLDGASYVQVPTIEAYDIGDGAFTVEAWICTQTAGTIVAKGGGDSANNIGWWLAVDTDGALEFGTRNREKYVIATTKTQLLTFDGSWHHIAAVRNGLTPVIYVDGIPIPSSIQLSTDRPVNVDSSLPLTIGSLSDVSGGGDLRRLKGSVDEVRLWRKAFQKWEIDQGIYHINTSALNTLLLRLSFDDNTFSDTSTYKNNGKGIGRIAFDVPAFYPIPNGQSFFVVQTCLLEDYIAGPPGSGAPPQQVDAFRVTIGVRDGDATPQPSVLRIGADQETTLIHRGRTLKIGPETSVEIASNISHEVNVLMLADPDSLVMPILKLATDFMEPGERILVPVDRQIHHTLSEVTGQELLSGPRALLDASAYTLDQSEAVAATMRNVMAAAVEHDMQPADPQVIDGISRTRAPIGRRSVRRAGDNPKTPEQEKYLSVSMPCPCYDPSTDLLKCHYAPEDGAIARRVIPAFMPTQHFEFKVADRSFTPLSESVAQARLMRATIADAALEAYDAGNSIWDAFVDGLLNVVDIVVSAGRAIVDGITIAIGYIKDGITRFANFVIRGVKAAAEFIKGLLNALGIALKKMIEFLKAVFDWPAILRAHRVLHRFIGQSMAFSTEFTRSLRRVSDKVLDNAKDKIDDYFDQAIAYFNDKSYASIAAPVTRQAPTDIRSNYVNQQVADNIDACEVLPVSGGDSQALQDFIDSINADAGSDIATYSQQNMGAIADTMPQNGDVMSQFVITILEALKLGVDLAIDIAEKVIDLALDFLAQVSDQVRQTLERRIDIPVLTWLYENVITDDGSQLSLLDLIALGGAVPTHFLCVLTQGKSPFTEAFVEAFEALTWRDYPFFHLLDEQGALQPVATADAFSALSAVDSNWLVYLSMGQLGVYGIANFVYWGINSVLAESDQLPVDPGFSTRKCAVLVGAGFISQAALYPICRTYRAGTPGSLDISIWALQFLPLGLDSVNLGLAIFKPAGVVVKTFLSKVQPGITTAWGAIHGLMFVALGIWELVDKAQQGDVDDIYDSTVSELVVKLTGNIVSTLPEIFQFLNYTSYKWTIPIVDLCSAVAVGLISLIRVCMSASSLHVSQAH